MDVAAWLRGLGLERYAQAFRDAEVTPDVLPELTDADLRELGLPLGPRKAVLEGDRATLADRRPTGRPSRRPRRRPAPAERRQLTVMFVDLVGSTALAAGSTPRRCAGSCAPTRTRSPARSPRFEGHVAKFMGDGVLAYFGWPTAHEDDGRARGPRRARACVAAVARLATPDGERAGRPGRDRDRAGRGRRPGRRGRGARGGGGRRDPEPGRPAAGAGRAGGGGRSPRRTRRLLGGLFALPRPRRHALKGFAEPVRGLRRRRRGRGRGPLRGPARGRRLTPLVGREHELALLLDRWARAKDGEGQVVLLSGEPGIGKSRLVRALRERLAASRTPRSASSARPTTPTPRSIPVIGLLERAAGLRREDPPSVQLDKLEAMLARAVDDVGEAAPAARRPARHPGRRTATRRWTSARSRRRSGPSRRCSTSSPGLAAQGPVLALYEDVHWADPTTLELIGPGDRAGAAPAGAGAGHLPARVRAALGRARARHRALAQPARAAAGRAMVERVTGGKALPAEVLEQILARTDGVPLFVEELTKAVLESGLLATRGATLRARRPAAAARDPLDPAGLADGPVTLTETIAGGGGAPWCSSSAAAVSASSASSARDDTRQRWPPTISVTAAASPAATSVRARTRTRPWRTLTSASSTENSVPTTVESTPAVTTCRWVPRPGVTSTSMRPPSRRSSESARRPPRSGARPSRERCRPPGPRGPTSQRVRRCATRPARPAPLPAAPGRPA